MDKLLTTKEVSKILGVTRPRVKQLIDEGTLPAKKFGRDWMIKRSDAIACRDRDKYSWKRKETE